MWNNPKLSYYTHGQNLLSNSCPFVISKRHIHTKKNGGTQNVAESRESVAASAEELIMSQYDRGYMDRK